MALDTSRGRLERLARRSRKRADWATASHGARSVSRERVRRRWVTAAVVAGIGLVGYRLGPQEIGAWIDRGVARVSFLGGASCEDVSVSYDRAIHSLGTSMADSNRRAFERVRLACERTAGEIGSASRADACHASASLYARAFDRRTAIASVAAVRLPAGGGIIGASAAGIIGGDDVEETEVLARRMMADCTG